MLIVRSRERTFTRVAERGPLFDESQNYDAAESQFDGARDSCRPRSGYADRARRMVHRWRN